MRNYNFSRTLFQLFALGLFVYQFQNSIIKYITGPITTQTSTTTLDEIEKPLIYLCQEGQFNYTEAKKIGYGHLKEFTMGKLLGSGYNYTWNGRYGNISYHEIQDRIYNNDYSNVSTWNSETGDLNENGYYYVDTKMVYFAPLGFCLNMLNITKKFTDVAITEKSQLYLVDRAGANRLRMYGSNVAKILFGPTDLGYYDRKAIENEVRIQDLSIHDGKTCMNYERIGTSYDSCVLNEMEKFLLEWYKCLPPWFPRNSTLTCQMGKVIEINDENWTMHTQFNRFIDGLEINILKLCLPPCVTMHFKLNEVKHFTNEIDYAFVSMEIKDEIIVYTDVYAYDIFNLFVDLGSSLGLWLGLSALSIFDTLVEFYMTAKRKYYH